MAAHVVVCHRVDRTTRIRRWILRLGTVVLGVAAALLTISAAHAFWTAGGLGLGSAATGTMTPADGVSATSPAGSDTVSLSWTPAAVNDDEPVEGYYVTREPTDGGGAVPACGTSPTAVSPAESCTDVDVPDGEYRYVVTAVLGSWTELSARSGPVTVRLNTDAPSVVAVTSPTPNENGYNRTSPVTVQLTASDSDGISSITYTVDDEAAVTVASDTTSVPLAGEGTHTVTFSATDALGRQGPETSRVVRIDTIVPAAPSQPVLVAASDSGLSAGDRITSDRTPTFTGSAEPGSTVQLLADGTVVGSATASLDGSFTLTPGELLDEGERTITVRAMDLADNVSASSTSTVVTIDSTAPSTPDAPDLLESDDSGRSSDDGVTNVEAPTFTGAATGGVVGVVLHVDGEPVSDATVSSSSYMATVPSLPEGDHSVTVRVSDAAGNVSASSSGRSVTIDTSAPAAPSAPVLADGDDSGASATDGVTNVAAPTVVGSNEGLAVVTVYDGAAEAGVRTTTSANYSVGTGTLSDGEHTLTARATDVAGNVGPLSTGTVILIDTVAPVAPAAPTLTAASDSGESSSDGITNDSTPTFTATAQPGSEVTLFAGSVASGPSVVAGAGGSWTATTATLDDGDAVITARTDPDLAGNVGVSPSLTVTIDTTAPAPPPMPTLTAPSDSGRSSSDAVTNVKTPTFFDSGSIDVVGARLYDGGVQVGSAVASPGYTVTASQLADGVHPMTVRVYDVAGNLSASSPARSVTIDTVAPAAPTAPQLSAGSDSGSSNSDRLTNVTTPTFEGTNEASALVTLYDGAVEVGSRTTAAQNYSVTSSALSEGSHTLKVTATDVAGNVGPQSLGTTITIDITAPTAPGAPALTSGSDTGTSSTDGLTNDATPTLTGTAPNQSSVTLFKGENPVSQPAKAAGSTWTITSSALGDGVHVFTARSDPDAAGNVGISPATAVTIDTVGPTLEISVVSTTAVIFRFTFSEAVYGTSYGVQLSGTARPTSYTVTGSGPYDVQVQGMDRSGTVVVGFNAGQVTDAAGNGNQAPSPSSTTVIDYVHP